MKIIMWLCTKVFLMFFDIFMSKKCKIRPSLLNKTQFEVPIICVAQTMQNKLHAKVYNSRVRDWNKYLNMSNSDAFFSKHLQKSCEQWKQSMFAKYNRRKITFRTDKCTTNTLRLSNPVKSDYCSHETHNSIPSHSL